MTRAYHLFALPANRTRVLADWITELIAHRQVVQFGLIPEQGISLAATDRRLAAGRTS